jgi:hypothetical protein
MCGVLGHGRAPAHVDGGKDCFTLTLGDKPKDAALPVELRLTLTGSRRARDDDGDASVEIGAPRFTRQSPVV